MVAITYRTLGEWGAGKGANLQPSEVDANFYSLAQAIVDIQNNPEQPNGIESIQVSGTQMTIYLTNGDVMGPFTLPVLTFRWRDEWDPFASYAVLDVFKITDLGIFMVQVAHTGTGAAFDPDLATPEGYPYFLQLFGATDMSLAELGDVSLTDLQDNDFIKWVEAADPANSKWQNVALGDMIYQDADSIDITGGRITGLTAPVAPSDAVTKAYVDALPAGMMVATNTMMANISGLTGPALPNSLSAFLDYTLGTTTRGAMLYRSGAAWVALAPGTAGLFLKTGGPGADPVWALAGSGVTSITAGAGMAFSPSPITSTGTIALAPIANLNLLANTSGGSAVATATTLTLFLDAVLGNARGTVLTRGVGGWAALAPGVAGQYLKTQGAGADAAWDSPAGAGTVTSISAGTGITTGGAPITGAGTVGLAAVADLSVLANTSGSSAAPVPTTVSLLFDRALGTTQGAVLYRSASAWVALAPGTAGQVLTTGGASANPSWSTGGGGGGSPPGGTSGQVQYNASGAFGGFTVGGDATLNTTTGALTLATVNSNTGSFQGLVLDAKGRVTGATNQSYLTANQTITLSGDVGGSGSTSITTTIGASAVTYSKMQTVTAARLLGNPTGTAASPSEIALGTNLSFSGNVLNAAGGAGTTPVVTTKTANYTVAAGDLGNTLILGGAGFNLTLPAGIFTPGKSLTVSVTSTSAWFFTNSTGLTMVGLNTSVSLTAGSSGTFIANVDGTTLNFIPGTQQPTTTTLGGARQLNATTNLFVTGLNASGVFTSAQPSFSNISGTLGLSAGGTNATTAAAALTNLGGLSSTTAASTYLPLVSGSATGNLTVADKFTVNDAIDNAPIAMNRSASTGGKAVLAYLKRGALRWELGTDLGNADAQDFFLFDDVAPAVRIQVTSNGDCLNNTGTWIALSDASVKSDVRPYERGLSSLVALNPVAFKYTDKSPFAGPDDPVRYGLIAQEVEPHVPEAVGTYTHKPEGAKISVDLATLDPGHLIYVLINSCKELAARVEALEAVLASDGR